jgi:ankyrin repeat protein
LMPDFIELVKKAVLADDGDSLRKILENNPELRARVNEPAFFFDSPAIVFAAGRGKRQVIDALLDSCADINARSEWWAGSFGVLDGAVPHLAAYLIERGALVDAHSAARLGMFEQLREIVSAHPELVHARGGDGQTPLHFASTVEIVEYLLDRGANIDALDIDHESTPAQYMIGNRQAIARYLIGRGAKTDIFMAAAIGDADLVHKHLDIDPECIRMCVNEQFFPKQDPKSGGTIYIWTLGANRSPHQVASKFGHPEVLKLLLDRSPVEVKLINSCLVGDETSVKTLLAGHPSLIQILSDTDCRQVSNAAEDNNTEAVGLMLESGWPVDGGGHGATPLHWAAWHGNAEMAEVILRHSPPLEVSNPATYDSTPLGWAIHGSEHGWNCKSGNYAAVVELLLKSGAKPPGKIDGSDAVRAVLPQR